MRPLQPLQANQADGPAPDGSAWLSASAGTGKTHVLTARILRLLLDGAAPERIRYLAESIRRGRGPQKAPTKTLVSLRLSGDVIEKFKAGGPGWQTRIDAALRKAVGL